MSNKSWNILSDRVVDKERVLDLSGKLGISDLTAQLLINRGIVDSDDADRFFKFTDTVFHDPYLLYDMEKAVARIEKALSQKEKIVIYGDYDVDGITSSALIFKYLKSRGCSDISFYIPERVDEGYGLNNDALDRFSGEKANLIITVDTGVTAFNEVLYASGLGIDVIVTDHHECPEILPQAVAIINPKRVDMPEDERYPFQYLAGVGVAFKLVSALEISRLGRDTDYLSKITEEYCDLVAVGTISDIMPLLDENRLFVKMGLSKLNKRPGIGWSALRERISGEFKTVKKEVQRFTSSYISFSVAPRLNAAGRMDRAENAVSLLLSQNESEALDLADYLCSMNTKRQNEENQILEEAVSIIERDKLDSNPIIIVESEGWRSGIIGVVSSRITERYQKPSILISFKGSEGKGSGRSLKGLNLFDALNSCSDLLTKFGGHELAAGLTIQLDKLNEFKQRIYDFVNDSTEGVDIRPALNIECAVAPSELTVGQVRELALLEPFGTGNPTPNFLMRDCVVNDIMDISSKHTKIVVSKDGLSFPLMFFNSGRSLFDVIKNDIIDVVFQLSLNDFRGDISVQLIGKDYSLKSVCFDEEDIRRASLLPDFSLDSGIALSKDMLPSRDDFAKIYLYLKRRPGIYISNRELATVEGLDLSLFKVTTVLYVLESAGLINVVSGSVGKGIASYMTTVVRSKVDLMTMPLLRKLNSLCK